MFGVGIDVVDLQRFREILIRRPKIAKKIFSEKELEDMDSRSDPVPGLAGRFCAKEAFLKAMGKGLFVCDLREIEVHKTTSGAPKLHLRAKAAVLANELGAERFDISISHSDLVATAVVIIS